MQQNFSVFPDGRKIHCLQTPTVWMLLVKELLVMVPFLSKVTHYTKHRELESSNSKTEKEPNVEGI